MSPPHRLTTDFYARNTLTVAQDLIGHTLHFQDFSGIITETEAYCGVDDPASHASRGRTPRTDVMFGPPGYSYVYLIYGMYHCLNIVTEATGYPAAVLIRGLYLPAEGLSLNGPGKVCRHLNLTLDHNRQNLTTHPDFYVSGPQQALAFQATPRIGIKRGLDRLWRFVVPKP